MNPGKSQQRAQRRLIAIGRAMVASLAMLSLLSVLLPLRRASANSGLKACCVGKAGHESGSCSTGLLEAAKHGQVEPLNSFSVEPTSASIERTAKNKRFANVKGGAGATGHCSSHASDSEIEAADSDPATKGVTESAEPTSVADQSAPPTPEASSPLSVHAVSSTCPNECGMCSVSYTRRPRPREQSTQSAAVRPPSTSLIRLIVSESQSVHAVNLKWSPSPPRAPPTLIV